MGIKIEKPRIQHCKPWESTLETRGNHGIFDIGTPGFDIGNTGTDIGNQEIQHWKPGDLTLETRGFNIGNPGIRH